MYVYVCVQERKYVPSQDKILALRKALMQSVISTQFGLYVSIKGEYLQNDVFFWQEIQKCKVRSSFYIFTD